MRQLLEAKDENWRNRENNDYKRKDVENEDILKCHCDLLSNATGGDTIKFMFDSPQVFDEIQSLKIELEIQFKPGCDIAAEKAAFEK